MNPSAATPSAPAPASSTRLESLDALRGFDMIWILGLDAVVLALAKLWPVAPLRLLAGQVDHSAWAGLTAYDLIFPLFVFLSGVALALSLPRSIERIGRARTIRHVVLRAVVLALLGLFYNGGLTHVWPDVRLLGVLQRIGFAFGVSGVLFCLTPSRVRLALAAGFLGLYWALMTFVPVRDVALSKEAMIEHFHTPNPDPAEVRRLFDQTTATVRGRFEPGLNLANHLDYQYLPGRKYDTYWDPEGMLSMLPAISGCLLGVLAGECLARRELDPRRKTRLLLVAGGICLALGYIWSLQFPIVKKIWTSSFVLVAAGWSFLLLALFHHVIDVLGWRNWCRPFVWIGRNPITLYLATFVVGMSELDQRIAGGSVAAFLDRHVGAGAGELGTSVVFLGLLILLARFLHQRGIFLRV